MRKMHSTCDLEQFEQGLCLSHFTLRSKHRIQENAFGGRSGAGLSLMANNGSPSTMVEDIVVCNGLFKASSGVDQSKVDKSPVAKWEGNPPHLLRKRDAAATDQFRKGTLDVCLSR